MKKQTLKISLNRFPFFLMPCFCLTVSEEMFHDEFDSFREQKDYIKKHFGVLSLTKHVTITD